MSFNMKQEQRGGAQKQFQGVLSEADVHPIIRVPLQFMFPPVEALSKELTKLNSTHQYRIVYLGPRWDNSVTFHKRYTQSGGYEFDFKRVNKSNNVCQDSMSHNQFYKNEIYYRAFQGMNPTLKPEEELIFESRFESGNLDCVVKVAPNEYDLFLRIDSNTRGNIYWFYFATKSHLRRRVRFNICNLTKNNTHYSKGLNPFVCKSRTSHWSQDGFSNVIFSKKRLRYSFLYEKMPMGTFYQLSFDFDFQDSEERRFAYCIPYTYSDLLADLKQVQKQQDTEVGVLGRSLTGLSIPYVCFGKTQEETKQNPIIMITGRAHPGESNSSLMLSRLMKELCRSEQMKFLRQKLKIIVVPMLNPDGVILGNSRAGASGIDLNRQFRSKNQILFPEVAALKRFVRRLSEDSSIEMYLDFHGHSRRQNMFMFGPNYSISQSMYYKCRVLPKLLSGITPIFRYYGCSYEISQDKRSTARAVMLRQMLIPYVYTVQTSLGFYYDRENQKLGAFNRESWENLGVCVLAALKEHYLSLEQLQHFMLTKKGNRKNLSRNGTQIESSGKGPDRKNEERELRMFELLQQIKALEDIKHRKSRQEDNEGDSSDSHDSKEELEREKLSEFTEMIAQCIQKEEPKQKRSSSLSLTVSKNKIQEKNRRLNILKRRQERQKVEEEIFNSFELSHQSKEKRGILRSEVQKRSHGAIDNLRREGRRGEIASHQIKRQVYCKDKIVSILQQNTLLNKQIVQSSPSYTSAEKKSNKINIRMFNFQKAVADNQRNRIPELLKKNSKPMKMPENHHRSQFTSLSSLHLPEPETPLLNEQNHSYQQQHEAELIGEPQPLNKGEVRHRDKFRFPPNCFKIKYQNKRKAQQSRREKSFEDQWDIKNAFDPRRDQKRAASFIGCEDERQGRLQGNSQNAGSKDNCGLFSKISQFPIL